ncbi:MAG: hypothetical protein WCF23_18505 [Candidatus Nitrosopolaris sp.]
MVLKSSRRKRYVADEMPTSKNNIFSNNQIIRSSPSTTTNLAPSETPNAKQGYADTS